MRIRVHHVRIAAIGERIQIELSQVVAEPDLWADGKGFCGHPHLIKLALGAQAGRILLIYNVNEAVSGLTADRSGFYNIWMQFSDDDGVTWSAPAQIFTCGDVPEAPGTPAGIVALGSNGTYVEIPSGVNAGRIVVPIWWNSTDNFKGSIYSDDQGATWTVSTTNINLITSSENTISWLPNGDLLMTIRDDDTPFGRFYAYSTDDGVSWVNQGLIADFTAINCNASTLQIDPGGTGGGIVLWAGPTTSGRETFRIRRSIDGGVTWPDEYAPFQDTQNVGYNSMRMLNSTELLLAYETWPSVGFNATSSVRLKIIDISVAFP